jgi:hypothetical protein
MTIRKRRCLLTVAIGSWVVFTMSMFAGIDHELIIAQQGLLGVSVTLTLAWVLLTAVAPAVAALRALLAAKAGACPVCNPLRAAPATHRMKSISRVG